jgi:hypothetical protein
MNLNLSGYYNYASAAPGICLLLALIAGVVIFFLFMPRHKDGQFTGFLLWLRDFLNFKTLLAENVLRLLYIICACWITLMAFAQLFAASSSVGASLLSFLLLLIVGNVVARILFEFILVILLISKNTTEINTKLDGLAAQAPTAPPAAPEPEAAPPDAPAPPVSFCRNCGSAIPDSEELCPRCGIRKINN